LAYDFSEEGLQRFYLLGAWIKFLAAHEWCLYCHLTFPSRSRKVSANRSFDVWIHDLNRRMFGHRYWKRGIVGISWARGSERQERGDVHFHALLGNCKIITPEHAEERWKKITKGGNAKIEIFDASKKGIEYIVKNHANIEVSKTLTTSAPALKA